MSDFWIMRSMSPLFFVLLALSLIVLAAASVLLRGKDERAKARILSAVCWATLLGFFVYKYFLSIDPEFNEATASMGGFNWWGELPLQLCNINMLFIPVAALKRWRPLLSFCFFVAPLGALMALVMPGLGFDGYSIFLPRMIGYFGTHYLILIEGLALATLGLYRPRFRDLPLTAAALTVIALLVFGINMLLRATGLHPQANYFFSVETEGNFLLELFYSWIPIPFLYLLPGIVILIVYAAAVTLPFTLAGHRRRAGNAAAAAAGRETTDVRPEQDT